MRPTFKIAADSQDITDTVRKRLVSLIVSYESQNRVDSLSLTLDNNHRYMNIPKTRTKIELQIGYEKQLSIYPLTFTLDEIQYSGPPFTVTLRARSANLTSSIRSHKERIWENTSFRKILQSIANEHGLDVSIEDDIADFNVHYYAQLNSDFATIGELALKHLGLNVQTEIIQNKIVVATRGATKTIKSKQNIKPMIIPSNQILHYNITTAERGKYNQVIAKWLDITDAEEKQEIAGAGEPTFIIKRLFNNQLDARLAAKHQLHSLNQGVASLRLSITGRPELFIGVPIQLRGLPNGADGIWLPTSITHRIDSSGFTTEITAKSK